MQRSLWRIFIGSPHKGKLKGTKFIIKPNISALRDAMRVVYFNRGGLEDGLGIFVSMTVYVELMNLIMMHHRDPFSDHNHLDYLGLPVIPFQKKNHKSQ